MREPLKKRTCRVREGGDDRDNRIKDNKSESDRTEESPEEDRENDKIIRQKEGGGGAAISAGEGGGGKPPLPQHVRYWD